MNRRSFLRLLAAIPAMTMIGPLKTSHPDDALFGRMISESAVFGSRERAQISSQAVKMSAREHLKTMGLSA